MADINIYEKNAKKRLLTAITSLQESLDNMRSTINNREHHQMLTWHVDNLKNQMKLVEWLTAEYDYARTDEIKRESMERRANNNTTTATGTDPFTDGWAPELDSETSSSSTHTEESNHDFTEQ